MMTMKLIGTGGQGTGGQDRVLSQADALTKKFKPTTYVFHRVFQKAYNFQYPYQILTKMLLVDYFRGKYSLVCAI